MKKFIAASVVIACGCLAALVYAGAEDAKYIREGVEVNQFNERMNGAEADGQIRAGKSIRNKTAAADRDVI